MGNCNTNVAKTNSNNGVNVIPTDSSVVLIDNIKTTLLEKQKPKRPKYKSVRQLILETAFTKEWSRFHQVNHKDLNDYDYVNEDGDYESRPKIRNKDTLDLNPNSRDSSFIWLNKDEVLEYGDNNSTATEHAFKNRKLSKIRKYILKYRTLPIFIIDAYADVLKNGPCGDIKEIAIEYKLDDFQKCSNAYQLAANFLAQRCVLYWHESRSYQIRQLQWNTDDFKCESIKKYVLIDELLTKIITNNLANIVLACISYHRTMKTCNPKRKFVVTYDGKYYNWSHNCYLYQTYIEDCETVDRDRRNSNVKRD